jgi:hypothetical protein
LFGVIFGDVKHFWFTLKYWTVKVSVIVGAIWHLLIDRIKSDSSLSVVNIAFKWSNLFNLCWELEPLLSLCTLSPLLSLRESPFSLVLGFSKKASYWLPPIDFFLSEMGMQYPTSLLTVTFLFTVCAPLLWKLFMLLLELKCCTEKAWASGFGSSQRFPITTRLKTSCLIRDVTSSKASLSVESSICALITS